MTFGYVGTELELFREARNWKRYLRSELGPHIRGDVLEVGAGIGGTTLEMHAATATSWTCLEPDGALAANLAATVAGLRDTSDRAPLTVIGSLATVNPAARYDSILYIDVLEHIEDDRGELAAAAKLLRVGGELVVMSPAHQWLYTPFDRAIGHFRRYDRKSLRAISPDTTELVRLRYLDCVGVTASLGNRLLLRKSMPTAAQIGVWDRFMVPVSRVVDPLLAYRLGKSVVAVWRRGG